MTTAEKKQALVARMNDHQILEAYVLANLQEDWQLASMVRGWMMDEMEARGVMVETDDGEDFKVVIDGIEYGWDGAPVA